MADPFDVAMSKVTPPNAAGEDSETVNAYDVVPEFPSICETLATERIGRGLHNLIGVAELRGLGAAIAKSALLTSVSEQPSPVRMSAVVFNVIPFATVPSKQLAVP
jgi:hypothetical protein